VSHGFAEVADVMPDGSAIKIGMTTRLSDRFEQIEGEHGEPGWLALMGPGVGAI
jgi:hypothetical protein